MSLAPPASPAGPATRPGALVVWAGSGPAARAFEIPAEGLIMGRDLIGAEHDDRISRQHARIEVHGDKFRVVDLGSRNGTFVGGQAVIDREVTVTAPAVVRTGRTVFLLVSDIARFQAPPLGVVMGVYVGASTAAVWRAVEAAATAAISVCIYGEEGTQKGRIARAYASLRGLPDAIYDPSVHAVPVGRVLKPDTQTLVLENINRRLGANAAELMRLLGERPQLRVVSTCAVDVRGLGLPPALITALTAREVEVGPLRDRPDELAHLVGDAVQAAEPALQIHSSLIEACLLRPWPQNARELTTAVGRAANAVAASGKASIRGEDLDNMAGHLMMGAPTMNVAVQPTALGLRRRRKTLLDNDE